MYICICIAVTEEEIKEAIRDGAKTVTDIAYDTGACTNCGKCQFQLEELLKGEGQCPNSKPSSSE